MSKAETALKEQDNDESLIIEDKTKDDDGDGEITREDLLNEDQDDDTDAEDGGDDTNDDSSSGEGDDEEEFEIVLAGDGGSHPKDDDRGIRKRINKLNRKVDAANEGKTEAERSLEIANERVKLLEIALDQKSGDASKKDAPPDPNDFDDGIADPAYVKAFQDHIAAGVLAKAQESQTQVRTETETQGKLRGRQEDHYRRADALKVPDYDETEDKAISIIGHEVVKELILNSDKSEVLLYWLGKNPNNAEDLKDLIQSNPVKGALAIGRLEERLVAKPKSKNKPAPDPDREQRSGGSGEKRRQRGPKGATFE